ILCIGNSFESCQTNVEYTIEFLESLGFIINYSKSQITPCRSCKYLGFVLDSQKYRVEPTSKKRSQIISLLRDIEPHRNYKIRTIAHVIGILRAKWLALLVNNNDFEGSMKLNETVFEDVLWWKRNISKTSSRIKTQNYSLVISSDASRTGWGAESQGNVTHGFWSPEDQKLHINHLELLAAFFALKCFASEARDCEILLRIDNTTAIAYINKAGGIKYPRLSELARTEIMLDSITESTVKQYEGCLKKWLFFADQERIDAFNPQNTDVIKFLADRFSKGAKYGTINSTRAAISLISQNNLSKDAMISRFVRGTFKKRPTRPKYAETWNTEQVLAYIETIEDINKLRLKELSEILTTLLILITAHRMQTLALINIKDITRSSTGLSIKIPDLIKTSRPGKEQPILTVPFFKKREKLCVASIMLKYLERTENLRSNSDKLFISTIKPHKPASAQTISHWIKSLLEKAGIDINTFTAYSVKHAAVSKACKQALDVDTIRRTAGWSAGSTVFARFYNRPIQAASDSFANTIINKNT
ncbi:GSCOCG00012690001-RA-CDS, partial [Cotesia congregata]